jgi:MoxR-like ATPase
MFKSISEVKQGLFQQQYIASDEIATVVFLAEQMGKPILAEGPAGVGKTELAKAWAAATNRELIRLQCYEGLDESKALYEWEYSKQMLYTQLLRDKLNQVMGACLFARRSCRRAGQGRERLLLQALSAPSPTAARLDERATRRAVDRRDRPRRCRV